MFRLGEAYGRTMPAVWEDVFGVAIWLRDESRRWRDERKRLPETQGAANPSTVEELSAKNAAEMERTKAHMQMELAERRCAMACLIHCCITVEACINAYAARFVAGMDEPPSKEEETKLERRPTGKKLLLYPRQFTGETVFDAKEEPHQSFRKLAEMRDFIVHPKPRMKPDDGLTRGLDGRPKLVSGGSAVSAVSALEEWKGEREFNADGAGWGCDVVRQIAEKLSAPGGRGLVFDLAVFDADS